MMNRFFGKKKDEKPGPSLDDASKNIAVRGGEIDKKVASIDADLTKLKDQIKKTKSVPAKKQLEQKAIRLLKQKKMYEKHKEHLDNQSFNIDQTKFATDNLKNTATLVSAMKSAGKELKTAYKDVNIDEIEDLHDDMSDMLDQANEVNEVMGQAYGVPDAIDEDELLQELDTLEVEAETTATKDEVPAYLQDAATVPQTKLESKVPDIKVPDTKPTVAVAESKTDSKVKI